MKEEKINLLEKRKRQRRVRDAGGKAEPGGLGWPGNVRELENTIEYAVLMGKEDGVIRGHDLPPTFQTPIAIPASESNLHTLKARVAMLERDMIVDSLKRHKGTISAAARELGITERMVRYKIQNLDIDYETLFKKRRKRSSKK